MLASLERLPGRSPVCRKPLSSVCVCDPVKTLFQRRCGDVESQVRMPQGQESQLRLMFREFAVSASVCGARAKGNELE